MSHGREQHIVTALVAAVASGPPIPDGDVGTANLFPGQCVKETPEQAHAFVLEGGVGNKAWFKRIVAHRVVSACSVVRTDTEQERVEVTERAYDPAWAYVGLAVDAFHGFPL
jgi:hypothetical protein